MSSKDKQISVIIAGATSSIGRELVSRLASHPNVQRVVALSRQPISVNRWATVFPHLHTGDALRYLSVVPVDWSKILTDTSRIPFSYVVNGSWHFTEMDARERKKLSSRLAKLHELWTLPYKEKLYSAQFSNATTSAINLNNNNNINSKYNSGQNTAFPANHVYDANSNTIHKTTSPELTQRSQQNFEKGYVSTFPRYSRVNYGRANSYRYRSLHRNREQYVPEISHLESSRSQETLQQHRKINKEQNLEPDQETNMSNDIGGSSSNTDNISVRHNRITNTNNTYSSPTQNLEEEAITTATTTATTNTQHVDKAHFLQKASCERKYKHAWWHLITSFVSSPLSIIEQMSELEHNSTKSSLSSPAVTTSAKSTINVLTDEEIMENKVFLQKLLENNFYNSVFAGHHVAINCLGSAHPLSSSELSQVDYGLSLAFTKVVRLFNCMSYVEANDEEERELVQRISRELNSELWGEIYTACYGTASEATPMLYSSSSSSCNYNHNHSINQNDSHNAQATHTSLPYGKIRREDEAGGVNRRCTLQHFTQISARGASEFSPVPYLRAHGRRDRDLIKMFGQTPSHKNVNLNSPNKNNRTKSNWNALSEIKQGSENGDKNLSEHEQLPVSDNSNSNTEKCTMGVSEEVAAEQARTLLLRRDIVHVNHRVNLTIWQPGVFRREYMRWPEWVISFLEQPLDLHCLAECVVDDIIESIHRYEEAAKQQDTITDNVDEFVSSSSNNSSNSIIDGSSSRDDTNRNTKNNKCDGDSSNNDDNITSDVASTTNTDTNAASSTLKIIGGKSVAQRVFMKAAEDGLDERDTKLPKSHIYNKYTHW